MSTDLWSGRSSLTDNGPSWLSLYSQIHSLLHWTAPACNTTITMTSTFTLISHWNIISSNRLDSSADSLSPCLASWSPPCLCTQPWIHTTPTTPRMNDRCGAMSSLNIQGKCQIKLSEEYITLEISAYRTWTMFSWVAKGCHEWSQLWFHSQNIFQVSCQPQSYFSYVHSSEKHSTSTLRSAHMVLGIGLLWCLLR